MTVIARTIAPRSAGAVVRAGRIAVRRAASRVRDAIRETASTESTSRGRQSYFQRNGALVSLPSTAAVRTPRSPGAKERWKSKRLETPGFKLFSTPSALVHHSTYAKFEAEVGSSTPLVEPKGDRTWQSF